MAKKKRTVVSIPSNPQVDNQKVINAFTSYILNEGYKMVTDKNEVCFQKGDGIWVAKQNFALLIGSQEIILQAWTGDSMLGESSLDGFMGWAVKSRMKKQLNEVHNLILQVMG